MSAPQAYDPDVHLNLSDLALDNHSNPSVIQLRIKQSKTDPFREGIHIFLGKTDGAICPVQAVIKYIAVRSPNPGPLFVSSEGTPLTRGYLVSRLQDALRRAGLDESAYNGTVFVAERLRQQHSGVCRIRSSKRSDDGTVMLIKFI